MRELFVGNVTYEATEDELKRFLESQTLPGAICALELKREENAFRRHRGYGFVTFLDEDVAQSLLTMGSILFRNRYLKFNRSKRFVPAENIRDPVSLTGVALYMGFTTKKPEEKFHLLWSTTAGPIDTDIDFRARKFHIVFAHSLDFNGMGNKVKLDFKFVTVSSARRVKVPTKAAPMLMIEVQEPPHIYESYNMMMSPIGNGDLFTSALVDMMQGMHLRRSESISWVRTIDFTPRRSIAQSWAYILEFPTSAASALNKALETLEAFQFSKDSVKPLGNIVSEFSYADMSPDVLVPLVKCPPGINLSFDIMYRLDELVQLAMLDGSSLSPRFFALLAETTTNQALSLLDILQRTATQSCMTRAEEWLEESIRKVRRGALKLPRTAWIEPEPGFCRIYRVLISPTMIWCERPEIELTNRVTRNYMHVIHNFLRVSFIEEDGTNLSSLALLRGKDSGPDSGESPVCKRLRYILRDGIHLHGKHFEFLAFSSSQLREQSVWMFAREGALTAKGIRSWMGNFLAIRNVAKCAARMGQCFSATTKTLTVDREDWTLIGDITNEKYCFSDGIGRIRRDFAKRVAAKCGRYGPEPPSAFQIRFGGFKGVVAVCNFAEKHLELRQSMQKFDSNHDDLEVITWTKALPCYLNRQIIALLSTLGVEDGVFQDMQKGVLSTLEIVVSNPDVALDLLQVTSSGSIHQIAKAMLQAGYHPARELYLRSLLQAFRAFQLLQLRTKARILVTKGRTMMGCLDESGALNYGEVFVQVSSFPGSRNVIDDGLEYDYDGACIVVGTVVVAKNPCLHPGDVRVLRAVYVPELSHMKDCVVFPQRGRRPHPDECSGSDLDGDLYFVSWDQGLVPSCMEAPMDYPPAPTMSLTRDVIIEDIQGFFVEHMKSDALGLISNAHVVWADREPSKARSRKCLDLSDLFTIAVDFPKTGVRAVMSPDLRVEEYPDFMEKDHKRSYQSHGVLGKLFRTVVGETRDKSLMSTFSAEDVFASFDEELVFDGFEIYIEEAQLEKTWYDQKLLGLMNQYGIKTEAEAVSGNVLPLSKFYMKKQGDVRDRINLAMSALRSEVRNWFKHGCNYSVTDGVVPEEVSHPLQQSDLLAKASAWYHVTYHRDYSYRDESDDGTTVDGDFSNGLNKISVKSESVILLSFPWMVYETLLEVKRRNRRR